MEDRGRKEGYDRPHRHGRAELGKAHRPDVAEQVGESEGFGDAAEVLEEPHPVRQGPEPPGLLAGHTGRQEVLYPSRIIEEGDAVGVLRLPSPRLDAVAQVSPAALFVSAEGRAPDALRGWKLGAVPVGDVANALGGQRLVNVAPFSSLFDKAPGVHEAAHHLADPSL